MCLRHNATTTLKANTQAKNHTDFEKMQQQFQLALDEDELTNCMRCGFCLPACPTYRETGMEAASPRGRIALMKGVYDGMIEPDEALVNQLDFCLGCRACELACPAGVEYGQLLEQAREAIEKSSTHPPHVRLMRTLFFQKLFSHPKRMRILGGMLKFYQKSGIRWLAYHSGVMKLFPPHMRQLEAILPKADRHGVQHHTGSHVRTTAREKKGTVGMLRGCLMDTLFTDTNRNTVKLLAAAGYDVVIPGEQTCCGALQAHSGETDVARMLAKQNIDAFKDLDVDMIISNAGGCGAFLQEYEQFMRDDPQWHSDAQWFSERLKDVNEVVWEAVDDLPLGPISARITYQDSCHLRNGMGVSDAPRRLLQAIPAAEYVELFEAERCCGSAGIYSLTHPDTSLRLLDEKMDHVEETGAEIVATSNPGCLLQMKLGIHREGLDDRIRAMHVVDILAASLDAHT